MLEQTDNIVIIQNKIIRNKISSYHTNQGCIIT